MTLMHCKKDHSTTIALVIIDTAPEELMQCAVCPGPSLSNIKRSSWMAALENSSTTLLISQSSSQENQS